MLQVTFNSQNFVQTLYLRFRKIRCLNFWIILIYFYNFIQCHTLTVEAANQIMAIVVIRLLLSDFIGPIAVDFKNSYWLFFASGKCCLSKISITLAWTFEIEFSWS
jgi:hypothetical protein